MVIPSRADELWILIQRDEMPPPDSPRGPLTPQQKEIIREWIAAGAPAAFPSGLDALPATSAESTFPNPLATIDRLLRWVGTLHQLMMHFPIALVWAAGIAEVLSIWRRSSVPSGSVRFCLWLGALAALPLVGLAWLLAALGDAVSLPQLLLAHRWLGTTAAVWLVVTALGAERDARRKVRHPGVRVLLTIGVLITALTALAQVV